MIMTRGIAKMTPDKVREISSKGGSATPPEKRSFSKDRSLASEAGKIGGKLVPPEKRSFSDSDKAREAGRKGGGSNKGKLDAAYVKARENGDKTYIPSKECRNGHRLRYTSSRQCVLCNSHPERDK